MKQDVVCQEDIPAGQSRRINGLRWIVNPFLLKGDLPSWNQRKWGKPQGKSFLGLIPEGEVKEDGIDSTIIDPG
jgi:hypothetical protein